MPECRGALKGALELTEEQRVEILCHRGWWAAGHERNTPQALSRAFTAGLGVETDLRDHAGDVVVSHDPPGRGVPRQSLLDLGGLLTLHDAARHTTLALNVKSDGLALGVAEALAAAGLLGEPGPDASSTWPPAFVFDAAVPDQLAWLRAGVPVFTRHSDVEPEPVLRDRAAGIWLDGFGPRRWWTAATVRAHLDAGRRVAVVSPELHGRDHRDAWDALLAGGLADAPGLALCTDHPAQALEVFG